MNKPLSHADVKALEEILWEEVGTQKDYEQIYFVNQIVEYVVQNGMLTDFSVLQEAPFTDRGSIVDIFADLSVWSGIRKVIDQINTNAVA